MRDVTLRRLLALLLLVSIATACQAAPPPLEAFGNLPAERDARISADGHWLAWIDQREARARIAIFDVRNRKMHRVVAAPDSVRIVDLGWGDDDVLLVVLGKTDFSHEARWASHEEARFIALNAQDGPERLLPLSQGSGKPRALPARLKVLRSDRPHTVIMSMREQFCHCLLAVDTLTGKFTILKHGNEYTSDWIVDRQGTAVARLDWDFKAHTYHLFALHDEPEKPTEIQHWEDSSGTWAAGMLSGAPAVVLVTTNGRPHKAVWSVPLDGSPMNLLVEDPEGDVDAMHIDSKTGALDGAYVSGPVTRIEWFDPALAKRDEALQKLFPGREVSQEGRTDDGGKVLVHVQGPATAPTYYLVDFAAHRADIAAEEYPGLAGVELAPTREITYAARDGTSIPAYLTTPVKSTSALPLVLLPHPGPEQRDFLQFSWMVQFLASRGYAVLQPQFRGSFGFGDAWLRAGFRQWGGLMQDDLTDGASAMVKLGVADARRLCVVGSGYGGYAALAGAAFKPDLFRCAVSIGGISDLNAWVREKPTGWVSSRDLLLKERVGAPGDAHLVEKSPINAVKDIHVPILLVYGTGADDVPNAQTLRMAQALREAGKTVKVVTLDKDENWPTRSDTRLQLLRELDSFLKENLQSP